MKVWMVRMIVTVQEGESLCFSSPLPDRQPYFTLAWPSPALCPTSSAQLSLESLCPQTPHNCDRTSPSHKNHPPPSTLANCFQFFSSIMQPWPQMAAPDPSCPDIEPHPRPCPAWPPDNNCQHLQSSELLKFSLRILFVSLDKTQHYLE